MTITIDIPAISELATAINNLANKGVIYVGPSAAALEQPPSGVNPDRVIAHEPQFVTADGQAADPQPAKRTRRTKAEMDAERKAIEETKGRRVDDPSPPPADPAQPTMGDTGFQWTLELLKDTFLAITPEDDSQEAKDAANAKLLALRQIREAIAPEAQNLSTMDEKHYAEFARQATAWYREQGLELNLPEGCEL